MNAPQNVVSNHHPFPSYNEIVKEIGKHLNERKKVLVRRIILITCPVVIAVLLVFGGLELIDQDIIAENSPYIIPGLVLLAHGSFFTML
jgi:hypothetical protein